MRIRLEAEAVIAILEQAEYRGWSLVSSQMAEIEILATPDPERRRRMAEILPPLDDRIRLTPEHFERAAALEGLGFKAADAVHVAASETLEVDVLLTCDDRMLRAATRNRRHLEVRVENPLRWLTEVTDARDSGPNPS